jgi:glycosyltransferase involved in cell wall biosynthesis
MPEIEIDVIQVGRSHSGKDDAPKNIHFYVGGAGWKDRDLSRYNLLIFTSLFEGMPNVILEAGERGLPIVTADVGGIRETLSEKSAKFYSPDDDIDVRLENITKAVKDTLSMSWVETENQIRAARDSILKRHGAEAFEQNIQRMLESLTNGRG